MRGSCSACRVRAHATATQLPRVARVEGASSLKRRGLHGSMACAVGACSRRWVDGGWLAAGAPGALFSHNNGISTYARHARDPSGSACQRRPSNSSGHWLPATTRFMSPHRSGVQVPHPSVWTLVHPLAPEAGSYAGRASERRGLTGMAKPPRGRKHHARPLQEPPGAALVPGVSLGYQ